MTRATIYSGTGDVTAVRPVHFIGSALIGTQMQTRAIIIGGHLPYARIWASDLTGSAFDPRDAYGVDVDYGATRPEGFDIRKIPSPGEAWPEDIADIAVVRQNALDAPGPLACG